MHQHRIEFDLGDLLAQPRRQQRNLRDQLRQRGDIRLRRAAKSVQQRRGLEFGQHRGGFRRAHRRRAIDHIPEQFGGDAAEADHDHRTEGRVLQRADDDLDALFRHRADQHALDRRIRPVLAGIVQQRLIGQEHLALGRDVDADAADFALVRDIRRLDLHDQGKAHAGDRGIQRALLRHQHFIGQRNARLAQQRLAVGFRKNARISDARRDRAQVTPLHRPAAPV